MSQEPKSKYNNKAEIIQMLKDGVKCAEISKRFNIPLSSVQTWKYEQLERVPEEFKVIEDIIPSDQIKRTEAKICSSFSEYICEEVTDDEWIKLQSMVNSELTNFWKNIKK